MRAPSSLPHALAKGTRAALAVCLLFPSPAFAAGGLSPKKAGSSSLQRGGLTPRVACQSPFVSSAEGCVCPPGLVQQGDTCVQAGRVGPAVAPSRGLQRIEGMKKAPSPGIRGTTESGLGAAPGTPPKMGIQPKKAFHLTPGAMPLAGEFGTVLQVRTIGSDVLTAWDVSHSISAPQPLTFRWKTQAAAQSARMKVSGLTGGSPLVLQESVIPLPTAEYGIFSFPFPSGFTGFIVQVIVTDTANQEFGSVPVSITYGDPGGPTPVIALPTTVLKITQIDMIDDSDDLSTGEVDFCFWATYSGNTSAVTKWSHGDFDSGSSASPNVQVSIDSVPSSVTLHAKGRDDDLPPGGFKSQDCTGSTSDFDFASGSRNINLPNGSTGTDVQPFSPFMATGSEDLEFRVHGTWQVVP